MGLQLKHVYTSMYMYIPTFFPLSKKYTASLLSLSHTNVSEVLLPVEKVQSFLMRHGLLAVHGVDDAPHYIYCALFLRNGCHIYIVCTIPVLFVYMSFLSTENFTDLAVAFGTQR